MGDWYICGVGVVVPEHANVSLYRASLQGFQLDQARVQVRVHRKLHVGIRPASTGSCKVQKQHHTSTLQYCTAQDVRTLDLLDMVVGLKEQYQAHLVLTELGGRRTQPHQSISTGRIYRYY